MTRYSYHTITYLMIPIRRASDEKTVNDCICDSDIKLNTPLLNSSDVFWAVCQSGFNWFYRYHSFSSLFPRSEEHTSELQSRGHLVCRLLLEKKKYNKEEFWLCVCVVQ